MKFFSTSFVKTLYSIIEFYRCRIQRFTHYIVLVGSAEQVQLASNRSVYNFQQNCCHSQCSCIWGFGILNYHIRNNLRKCEWSKEIFNTTEHNCTCHQFLTESSDYHWWNARCKYGGIYWDSNLISCRPLSICLCVLFLVRSGRWITFSPCLTYWNKQWHSRKEAW